MKLNAKLTEGCFAPLLRIQTVVSKLRHFTKLYILQDPFTVAIKNWVQENGDEYLLFDYPLTEKSIVFDLGGYHGDFTHTINSKYNCFVFVYEPIKKYHEILVSRFQDNSKIKCFNYGLSNQYGIYQIYENEASSSIIKIQNSDNMQEVVIKDFVVEFQKLQITNIDLLKINIEGPEFLILPHLIRNNIIQQIQHIQVQFHDFYPNAIELRKEIREALSKTHTEKWNYPFVWESWSRINASNVDEP